MYSDRQVSVRFPAVAKDEQGDRGVLATLHLEIIEDGTGVLYPDPRYHATTVSDGDFVDSMYAVQTCAHFPSPDTDEPVDVRWRIEFEWPDLQPSEIAGPSAGGAFAVGLMLLKRARLGPPVYWPDTHVVMATVDDEGRLDSVGNVSQKVEAIARGADTIDYVVLPDTHSEITIRGVGVITAGTVKQLLLEIGDDLMGGEPGPEFAADLISGHAEALESDLFFHEPTGAVQEQRRLDASPPFLFSEVTGFAVQDLVFMYRTTGNENFLDSARGAADWLTTEATREDDADTHQGAWSDGWCLTRDYIGGVNDYQEGDDWAQVYAFESRNVFRFDNAMVDLGLIDLYEETHDQELLRKIRELSDNLANAIGRDGLIYPVYNLDGAPEDPDDRQDGASGGMRGPGGKWSRQTGPYLVRVAEALLRAARMETEATTPRSTEEQGDHSADARARDMPEAPEIDRASEDPAVRYRSQARKLCRWTIGQQCRDGDEDGRFITHAESTHMHPHLYACEGLLRCGMLLAEEPDDENPGLPVNSEDCLEAAERGVRWALDYVRDGMVPREIGPDGDWPEHQRTDVVAQLLYLGSKLYQIGRFDDNQFRRLGSLAHAVWNMRDSRPPHFSYGYLRDGTRVNTPSYWTEFYAVQALLQYARAWLSRRTALVILAGGIGTRSWPVSCQKASKPLTTAFLGESLLTATVRRFLKTGLIRPTSVYILCRTQDETITRHQAQDFGIPDGNIVVEHSAAGTVQALKQCLDAVTEELVVVSMSDGLFSPVEGFAEALHRSVMTAQCHDEVIISLGMETDRRDDRYGHMVVDRDEELLVPNTFMSLDFVEKPTETEYEEMLAPPPGRTSRADRVCAWETGNVVASREYWETIYSENQPYPEEATIARHMLQDEADLAVALYAPNVRWADLGTIRADLLSYFEGTSREKGEHNISLNPNARVSFFKSRGCLVISDGRPVDVVGLSDHLIVDCSQSNMALVMPLPSSDDPNPNRLLEVYDVYHQRPGWQNYVIGGDEAQEAEPKNQTQLGRKCSATCEVGALLVYDCEDLIVIRTRERLSVYWEPMSKMLEQIQGTGHDNPLDLLRERAEEDPLIIRHVLDVCFIADAIQRMCRVALQADMSDSEQEQGLSSNQLTQILGLVSLMHDIGGVLVPEEVELERNILEMLSNVSLLDWPGALDSRIVEVMIREFSERSLTPREQDALTRFNDDVQSAIVAMRLEQIANHPYRDAIIWIVGKQGYGHSFADIPKRLAMSRTELAHIFACLKVADAICYPHTLWKPRVKPVSGDFASSLVYFADHVAPCLSQLVSPGVYIDAANNLLLEPASQGISLLDYVRRELRYILDGERREFVDLSASDTIYLELLWDTEEGAREWHPQAIVAPLLTTLAEDIHGSPSREARDELELLAMLPERLDCLGDHGVTTIAPADTISELAQAINAALINHGMLTAVPLPARDSLLRMLGYGRQ